MSFLDLKTKARRSVHNAFAVPCILTNGDGSFPTVARLHTRMQLGGDIASEGYASIIEGVNRVVFNREQLAALDGGLGVVPARGDQVVFTNYIATGMDLALELDARDTYEGPIDERWAVADFNIVSSGAGAGVGSGGGGADSI